MSTSPRPSLNHRVSGNVRDRMKSPLSLVAHHNHLVQQQQLLQLLQQCSCQNCQCKQNTANIIFSETTPLLIAQENQEQPLTWNEKLPYYLPCLNWIPQYTVQKLIQDLISGLSLASFQIPLAMSYAKTILHVPPICGLLLVLIPPIVYSMFGSIPQLIVGPEPSISIVVGGVIESMLLHDKKINIFDVVLVITTLSGFTLFGCGLLRFGFLDTVLSVALLKGFIAAVGVKMISNSIVFLTPSSDDHPPYGHFADPQLIISYAILGFLLLMKILKKQMMKLKYTKIIFLPEILITVIVCTVLSYYYNWESMGVSVVGKIHSLKHLYWNFPLQSKFFKYYRLLISSGLTCAILGFFESTTLSKLLGSEIPISSNRELVALGVINFVSGSFGSLPLFGGYGRSKINLLSGGVTCASGAFMGLVTIIVILFLLPYLYYLPNCCLSCITAIVGITILEEIPKDVKFFIKTRGWEELITFAITFSVSFLISMDMGIIMGTSYSIIRILKNSSQSRIQILKRVPGTINFINAIDNSLQLEDIENCLIVKIPEPLIFTNTNNLKLKLKRLEMYGSTNFHPATPRFKPHLNFIIFDINEMVDIDSSSCQILLELIKSYHKRFIKVYLVTINKLPKINNMLIRSGIINFIELKSLDEIYFNSIEEALKIIDQQNEFSDVASYQSAIPEFI